MKKVQGLSLIEVLVAMGILALAFTALIKATTENLRATAYLKEKTVASWVASDCMNRARLGLLKLPKEPALREEKITLWKEPWTWKASVKDTPNKQIQEINIAVYAEGHLQASQRLRGYRYVG